MRVSVVVPAYLSHDTVVESLAGLRGQAYRDFEVILVDSSPDERTSRLVTEQFPEVRLLRSGERLPPHQARNQGVAVAGGDVLVFTDPDCRARPDWLRHLVAAHQAGHQAVAGAMGLATTAWAEVGAHLVKFWPVLEGLPPGPRWIAPTANASYERALWRRVGPFRGDGYSDDALLSWRAAAAGARPFFEPRAVVEHRHAQGVASLARGRFERGRLFARARMEAERWPRRRALLHLLAAPALLALVLLRSARSSAQAGWLQRYLATLPLQVLGQAAWCLSEAGAHARWAWRGPA